MPPIDDEPSELHDLRDLLAAPAASRTRAPDFAADRTAFTWFNVARPLSLKSDLSGKVVAVHFWSSSSSDCMPALDALQALERELAGAPFALIGCHSPRSKHECDPDHVRGAVLRLGIEHPVVLDQNLELWRRFGVRGWPTAVLIAPDGTIAVRLHGADRVARPELLDTLTRELLALTTAAHDPRPLPLRLERWREPVAELSFPAKLAADDDRLFIADTGHHRVVVTGHDGRFLAAIGSGARGFADGAGSAAEFAAPQGLAVRGSSLLVADTGNHAVRAIDLASGRVTTIAGTGSFEPPSARGKPLASPTDLVVHHHSDGDGGDQVLIAMAGRHQIWRLDPSGETAEPLAGSGEELRLDGDFADSAFAAPSGLALEARRLFVADAGSSAIRVLDLVLNQVTTIAGGGPDPRDLFHCGDEDGKAFGRRFQHPTGIAVKAGVLYVADSYNHRIRAIDLLSGRVTTLAGTGAAGCQDGPAEESTFREPGAIAAVGRLLYVADTGNHRIRVIDLDGQTVSTLRLRGVPLPAGALHRPPADTLGVGCAELAATVSHEGVRVAVLPGPVLVELKLTLPRDATLVADAPSRFQARRVHGAIDADLAAIPCDRTNLALPVQVDGPGEIEVNALYYWRNPEGQSFLRAVRWPVEISIDTKGGETIALADDVTA